jgi:hypothetical protein
MPYKEDDEVTVAMMAVSASIIVVPIGGMRADFTKFIAAEKARLTPIARSADMNED